MKIRYLAAGMAAAVAGACTRTTAISSMATPAGNTGMWSHLEPLGGADRGRQALDRLTFGARPGDLAQIEAVGATRWIEQQLNAGAIADADGDSAINRFEIAHKTAFELAADHPTPNEVGKRVIIQGFTKVDSTEIKKAMAAASSPTEMLAAMRGVTQKQDSMAEVADKLNRARNGVQREIGPSLVVRAAVSDRQLLEVMTEFWENHFSVNVDKMPSPLALVDYDHAIRAHALGRFRDLLEVVAKSPAMLYYLDNYQSVADSLHPNPTEWAIENRRREHPPLGDTSLIRVMNHRRVGVNENYARELMELHTLGVDGGYTQKDVQEVARCLTGWSIDDPQDGGTFAFHTEQHDASPKLVLGTQIPGGRGVEDGEQVLDMLAKNPSTAHFIARKLVIHFVNDSPPPALVERAAQTFLRTDGDIREVMRTIVFSPEFNSQQAYRAKVKTPFELVVSILRVMNATTDTTQAVPQVIARLSQPIFGHLTPEGWPDQGAAWMNAGSLLNRINLGAQIGAGQIPSVSVAKWSVFAKLSALPADQQVDGVIDAVLAGDASKATRDAMAGVASAPGAPPAKRLGDLIGVAVGSSEFQHR